MKVRRVSVVASAFLCVLLITGCATTHVHTSAPLRAATTTSAAPVTTTSTQPAAAPGPTTFDPFSFTAVSLQIWWLLGSIPCDVAQRCPEILRTTDGGAHFEQLAVPDFGWVPNGIMDSGLRFADPSHGWIFGPGLWSTDDGGSTWIQQQVSGTVTDVEAADGEAYALLCPTGAASCPTMELLRTAVAGGSWSVVNLPAPLFGGSGLAVQGDAVFVMNGTNDQQGDQGSSLLVSTNGGRTFAVEQSECTPGLDGHVQPAITGGGVLWESCPTGMEAQGKQSDDYGETWHALASDDEFSNGLSFAAVSATTALVWPVPPTGGLALTTDGGRTLHSAFQGPAGSVLLWVGYSDPSRAYLLIATNTAPYGGQLWESNDGGATWAQVPFTIG